MRRKGRDTVGFMDATAINEDQVKKQPQRATDAIYRTLSLQHYKDVILLPYNFK
jgi:hypothetical protein